jgi:hypothetical protein
MAGKSLEARELGSCGLGLGCVCPWVARALVLAGLPVRREGVTRQPTSTRPRTGPACLKLMLHRPAAVEATPTHTPLSLGSDLSPSAPPVPLLHPALL